MQLIVKVTQDGNDVNKKNIEAEAYRSQDKRELPHHLVIETEDDDMKD